MENVIASDDSVNGSEILQLYRTNPWSGHCTYKWSAGRTGECDFRWLSGGVFPAFIGWSRLATTRHWSADHAKYAAILFRISSADFSGRSADNRNFIRL